MTFIRNRIYGNYAKNSRFWILLSAFLVSILIYLYFYITIVSPVLIIVRTEQTYGYLSLLLWYIVLLASPLSKILPNKNWIKQYLHARRALGVSTAYFALLHALFAFFGQLDGFSGIHYYPEVFDTGIFLGFLGLLVLLILAATSFDKMIEALGKNKWIWIHRSSYVAVYLVLAHVWIIGTHIGYLWVQLLISALVTALIALEAWRVILKYRKAHNTQLRITTQIIIFTLLWCLLFAIFATIPLYITSYGELHGNIQTH